MHRSVDAAILIFVTSTMLSLGLRVPGRAIQQGIRDARLLIVGTVVNLLLIPVLASLVAATFGLSSDVRSGFVLIALSPAAAYAIKLIELARGEIASSVGLFIILQLGGLVFVPVTAALFVGVGEQIHLETALTSVVLLQLTPFIAGLLAQRARSIRSVASRVTGAISNISFGAIVLGLLVTDSPEVAEVLATGTLPAILTILTLSLLIGYLLGGSDPAARRSLALLSSARKGGLALIVATTSLGSDSKAVVVITAYALVELLYLSSVAIWWRRAPVSAFNHVLTPNTSTTSASRDLPPPV